MAPDGSIDRTSAVAGVLCRRRTRGGPGLIGKLLVRSDGREAGWSRSRRTWAGTTPPATPSGARPPRRGSCSGPPGLLYVYFSYGVHWCANVVCGPEGTASAVLLRARAARSAGFVLMSEARWHGQRHLRERDLCRGPGRLCEAFGITGAHNGLDLTTPAGGCGWPMTAPGAAERWSPRPGRLVPGR